MQVEAVISFTIYYVTSCAAYDDQRYKINHA